MPQITFTQEEYRILSSAADKFMKVRKNLQPGEWKKPQNMAVKGFAKRFYLVKETGEQTRVLSRTDLRMIQELTQTTLAALKQQIIPTYEKRISDDPSKAADYQPYLDRARELEASNLALLLKIEEAL